MKRRDVLKGLLAAPLALLPFKAHSWDGIYRTKTYGYWSNPNTWEGGRVPTGLDEHIVVNYPVWLDSHVDHCLIELDIIGRLEPSERPNTLTNSCIWSKESWKGVAMFQGRQGDKFTLVGNIFGGPETRKRMMA